MGKRFNKIKRNLTIGWHSLFHGMAGADSVINAPSSSDGVEAVEQVRGGGGVFADMLEEKETQRVVEMRDTYYRVLKEADKWDVSNITMVLDKNGEVSFSDIDKVKKKTKADFIKHPPVFEEDGYSLRTIQDNKKYQKTGAILGINDAFDSDILPTGDSDFYTTLTVERDEFTPRFQIDKYTAKMVVRNKIGTDRALVDFYLPTQASQFGKVDAILISNLNDIWKSKNTRSDITDLKTIEWFSDKGWNTDDVCLFKYDDVHFTEINVFDGSFVLSFDCHIVSDGKYLAEKYQTKELDEKYATEAPKKDGIDIYTIMRREKRQEEKKKNGVDIDNLGTTTFKLS